MGRSLKLCSLFFLILSFSAQADLCEKSCQQAQDARIMSCFKNFQLCSRNPQNEDWCAPALDDCKDAAAKASENCVRKCEDNNEKAAVRCEAGCFHVRDEFKTSRSSFCYQVFICKEYDSNCSVTKEEEVKTFLNCRDIKPSI